MLSHSGELQGTTTVALDRPLADDAGGPGRDQSLTPKGPTGLLRALVDASAAREAVERSLPTMDAHAVGGRRLAVRLRRRARARPRRRARRNASSGQTSGWGTAATECSARRRAGARLAYRVGLRGTSRLTAPRPRSRLRPSPAPHRALILAVSLRWRSPVAPVASRTPTSYGDVNTTNEGYYGNFMFGCTGVEANDDGKYVDVEAREPRLLHLRVPRA